VLTEKCRLRFCHAIKIRSPARNRSVTATHFRPGSEILLFTKKARSPAASFQNGAEKIYEGLLFDAEKRDDNFLLKKKTLTTEKEKPKKVNC
jgi:hypothetical protein